MANTAFSAHILLVTNFNGIKSVVREYPTKKIMNSIVYIIGAVVIVVVVLKLLGLF